MNTATDFPAPAADAPAGRPRGQRARPCVFLLALALAASGCTRTRLSVSSPDRARVALVRSHFALDPPNESLWLQSPREGLVMLRHLAPDQDWCNTVTWSADSSTVAFLVQDARLLAFTASGEPLLDQWLVEHESYPSHRLARGLALSPDGSQAFFRLCPRHPSRSGVGAPCSPVRSMAIRPPRSGGGWPGVSLSSPGS